MSPDRPLEYSIRHSVHQKDAFATRLSGASGRATTVTGSVAERSQKWTAAEVFPEWPGRIPGTPPLPKVFVVGFCRVRVVEPQGPSLR